MEQTTDDPVVRPDRRARLHRGGRTAAAGLRVFTRDFGAIKPREHNLLPVPISETVVETHVGGHIIDRGADGSECRWARVLAFEPPDRFVFSWDISPHWQVETDPDKTSEVEVTFTALGRTAPGSTSSTATSTGTARAGPASATGSVPTRVGRSTSIGSRSSSPPDLTEDDLAGATPHIS